MLLDMIQTQVQNKFVKLDRNRVINELVCFVGGTPLLPAAQIVISIAELKKPEKRKRKKRKPNKNDRGFSAYL